MLKKEEQIMEAWDDLNKAIRQMLYSQPSTMTQRAAELEASRLMMSSVIEGLGRE